MTSVILRLRLAVPRDLRGEVKAVGRHPKLLKVACVLGRLIETGYPEFGASPRHLHPKGLSMEPPEPTIQYATQARAELRF